MNNIELVSTFVTAIGMGGIFLYIKSIGKTTDEIKKDVKELKNGCFQRHMEISKESGRNEMTLEALHKRLDKIDIPYADMDRR